MRNSSIAQRLGDQETVNRLREKLLLVTTCCDALGKETAAQSQDFAALIIRLSREIDETILPRKYALFSDAGLEATLVVSNRRLIELEIDGKKIEFNADADTNPDTVARSCAKALRALCLRSGQMRLRLIGRAQNTSTKSGTCTARHLVEYTRSSNLENRLKTFLKLSHARSLGWVYRAGDGQMVEHDTDEEIMAALHRLQQAEIPSGDDRGHLSRLERVGPICSAFALTPEKQVIIAEDGKNRLHAAFPTSELIAVMAIWHHVFKRLNA